MFRKPSIEYLIAGLGNPGPDYERTRHNVGFRALDYLAGSVSADVKKLRHFALTGKASIGGHPVLLMKPQTYMNDSGRAVGDAARYYKIPPERVIILVDDVSLPTGAARIRPEGSPGGHNGLKSVEEHLGSAKYVRLKFGVGTGRPEEEDLKDFVLGRMTPAEFSAVADNFPRMVKAIETILEGDVPGAMNLYNRSPKKE